MHLLRVLVAALGLAPVLPGPAASADTVSSATGSSIDIPAQPVLTPGTFRAAGAAAPALLVRRKVLGAP